MSGYASAWNERYSSRPNPRASRIAEDNAKHCAEGMRQRIGKPGGNNDARKIIATRTLPVVRRSIIG